MEITELITKALIFILPVYSTNAIPVITGKGYPLDFGKTFFDGRPVFGKNKTFRGFFSGLAVGTVIGIVESAFFQEYPIFFGFLLSLGALFGDLTGAFLKRRLGLAPGDLLPFVDQVDFIVGAIVFSLPTGILSSWEFLIAVLLITPPIHLLTNFAAYKLGLKNNPW